MKIPTRDFALLAGLLVLVGVILALALPYFTTPPNVPEMSGGFGAGTSRARVESIVDEGMVTLGEIIQPYQVLRVELLDGDLAGILIEVDYGLRQVRAEGHHFRVGDEIIVTLGQRPDGVITAYFVDVVRTPALLILALTFAGAILLISRWKGLRALLSMLFSLWVIIGYILPRILAGEDPLTVSIIGAAILLGVTLYLTYGWTLKTHASVISMFLVLLLTGALAWFFAGLTRLTGYGSEDALFLLQMANSQINLRGLMLGSMLIGALGVLDDLVTTQSAVIFELHRANPALGFRALFATGLRVGQDHIAATVNTLVLAYAGASMPMLLMFTLGSGDYGYLLNFEFVAEEVVRTLVGSLGLIAAVPLTTIIAALLALRHHQLGAWGKYLGPPTGGGDDHGHVH
jgi:uncharacterized membrane protein